MLFRSAMSDELTRHYGNCDFVVGLSQMGVGFGIGGSLIGGVPPCCLDQTMFIIIQF